MGGGLRAASHLADCNGGDHGQHFATNFNPEINIREVTAPARHWENGEWLETPALSHKQAFNFEAVGEKNMYLMYHEEIESLKTHLSEIQRIRFWMTFGDAYLTHLEVLQNGGMTSIEPVEYEGEISTYSPAYKSDDLHKIAALSDHIIFNSPDQIARHSPSIIGLRDAGEQFEIGLRINPLLAQGEVGKYDPCQPHSRLGFPVDQLTDAHFEVIEGLHFHALCEQDFEPLYRTWEAIVPYIEHYAEDLKWINFGGGHNITRTDYQREELVEFLFDVQETTGCQTYLEPGEAIALDAGILVGEVLDIFDNGMPVAITDVSATCHMPDVIEAPYRPAMLGENDERPLVRLGGPSCLAGDIIGDYRLPDGPQIGQRIAFLDQAIIRW